MKRILFYLLVLLTFYSNAQNLTTITIEECYAWSKENYPLIEQLKLIEEAKIYNLSNATKAFLPQINIQAQASYQSEVTSLPIQLPNIEIPSLNKDQYKIYADLFIPLSNAKIIKNTKEQINANAAINAQQLEVNLYELKNRINQIYFGIILIDEYSKQLQLLYADYDSTLSKTEAAIENGTAIPTNANLIKAELINTQQKIAENKAQKNAYINILAILTGKNIGMLTTLTIPKTTLPINNNQRPELHLFERQQLSNELQYKQINNKLIPQFGVFFQGGYGRPALNFLKNDFSPYYIGGLKMNWNIGQLYTIKKDKKIITINQQNIQSQQKVFELNNSIQLKQQDATIAKYQSFIENDKQLIELREAIKTTANIQLDNGLISALDYINYVNAASKAKLDLVLHQTELLMAIYQYNYISGN
ncbi:MAG: TolC family protein [Chitinophagales bacterium]|nr:TolC family protein [Chitinophagales bacterium]